MLILCTLLFVADEANPLLRELQTQGIRLSSSVQVSLPPFQMPDGLPAEKQLAIIEQLPGRTAPVEELLRPSTVAPFVLKFTDYDSGQPHAPGRGVALYFVAQGRIEDLIQSDFLERVLNSGRKDARIQPLTPAQLEALGWKAAPGTTQPEGWAYVSVPLMDRVVLSGTNHTRWHRTSESITVAARLDPRFTGDRELGNQWRLLRRDDDGKPQPDGPPQPYEAVGYTLKITQLRRPEGMLFIEWHLIFSEPTGWFDGANLLRSKLPLVLQTKVRGFRRDLLRDAE